MYQFPQHLNRVRAWDRLNGQTVEVAREDWNPEQFGVLVTGLNPREEFLARYWVPADALDFRYFGEPAGATWGVRRAWARRAAADRRMYWSRLHELSDRRLRALADADPGDPEYGTWLARLARSEVRRREAGVTVNAPSAAVVRADQEELARVRAAAHSRERQQEFESAQAERLNYRPGRRNA